MPRVFTKPQQQQQQQQLGFPPYSQPRLGDIFKTLGAPGATPLLSKEQFASQLAPTLKKKGFLRVSVIGKLRGFLVLREHQSRGGFFVEVDAKLKNDTETFIRLLIEDPESVADASRPSPRFFFRIRVGGKERKISKISEMKTCLAVGSLWLLVAAASAQLFSDNSNQPGLNIPSVQEGNDAVVSTMNQIFGALRLPINVRNPFRRANANERGKSFSESGSKSCSRRDCPEIAHVPNRNVTRRVRAPIFAAQTS
ncbi:unnamed protein product [Notodromas monacha]|uniref:Uncharacterized protein n=1 Tax=Notodromas monacha TaxID=399045 RepID=A0A7R9BFC4_9CRUS|nr:unnamed protein product [Notodromas monacha]CAG0913768.1 unnamed protein product [Notodromas monacha]